MPCISEDIELARNIKAFVSDVDGVFTNGWIGYGNGSDDETKFFNAKDGLGIQMLNRVGIITGVITGRRCLANVRRLQGDLHIPYLIDGCGCKEQGLEHFCKQAGVTPAECLYIGDDYNDFIPLSMVGLPASPCDAEADILKLAKWVSVRPGGHGAVRDMINRLLKAKGLYEEATSYYTKFLKERR